MRFRRWNWIFVFLPLVLLLVGCEPEVIEVTSPPPTPETVIVTATPTSTPPPTPVEPETLTICTVGEPDTLYLYGGSQLPATHHVMEAIYDGPIDHTRGDERAVILEKVPRLTDGDAVTTAVSVEEGDRVVDATGDVVELKSGVSVRPTGCRSEDCAIAYRSGEVEMEQMTVTFTLRDDVFWADGERVTITDTLFAFDVASDPATPGYRELVERTESYSEAGEWSVEWMGLPGYLPASYADSFFSPLPYHQLKGRSPSTLAEDEDLRLRPMGWGPFVVDQWVRGDHVTLLRNPYYFRSDEGLPRVERLEFRFAHDAADLTAQVTEGVCDVGVGGATDEFEPLMSFLAAAESRDALRIASALGEEWVHVDFAIDAAAGTRRSDFFEDVGVRRAIAQCIDRQAIVDEVVLGHSLVPDTYLSPLDPLYASEELTEWPYDPATGRALLEAVGWSDRDGDGVREAVGVPGVGWNAPFSVSLLVPEGDVDLRRAAEVVRANLSECGIEVEIEPAAEEDFAAPAPDGRFLGRRYDMALTAWPLESGSVCRHYLSEEIANWRDWSGVNPTGYANAEFDAACRSALSALPGTETHFEAHRTAQRVFSEELPAVPLYVVPRLAVAKPSVDELVMGSTEEDALCGVEQVDLE